MPREAAVYLETPREWAQLIKARTIPLKGLDEKKAAAIAIKPAGRTIVAETAFPAKARIPLRLLVNIPKELREKEFEIYARQLYGDEEVGRVTWRLAPKRKPQ